MPFLSSATGYRGPFFFGSFFDLLSNYYCLQPHLQCNLVYIHTTSRQNAYTSILCLSDLFFSQFSKKFFHKWISHFFIGKIAQVYIGRYPTHVHIDVGKWGSLSKSYMANRSPIVTLWMSPYQASIPAYTGHYRPPYRNP